MTDEWMDESFQAAPAGWRVSWVSSHDMTFEPIAGWMTQRGPGGKRRTVAARVTYPATIEAIIPDDQEGYSDAVMHTVFAPGAPDPTDDQVQEAIANHVRSLADQRANQHVSAADEARVRQRRA